MGLAENPQLPQISFAWAVDKTVEQDLSRNQTSFTKYKCPSKMRLVRLVLINPQPVLRFSTSSLTGSVKRKHCTESGKTQEQPHLNSYPHFQRTQNGCKAQLLAILSPGRRRVRAPSLHVQGHLEAPASRSAAWHTWALCARQKGQGENCAHINSVH